MLRSEKNEVNKNISDNKHHKKKHQELIVTTIAIVKCCINDNSIQRPLGISTLDAQKSTTSHSDIHVSCCWATYYVWCYGVDSS
jgi:hypothetical protein